MLLKVLTWNINSVRLRFPLLERLVAEAAPDVVCLQETKVPDELFPREAAAAIGLPHQAISGMKGYNGVAILSRLPLAAPRTPSWCGKEDCRHLVVEVAGIELHNLYVPAGGDIPDPDLNDKFAHKLAFLDELTGWSRAAIRPERPVVLVGDLNVAPLETDVWSHKQLLKVVSHTPIEVEKLTALAESIGWVDAVRHFIPPSERLYTWWSYRSPDWAKNDRGRRLDHVWVTPALRAQLRAAQVLRPCRDWLPPSDHVPVMVTLDVPGIR